MTQEYFGQKIVTAWAMNKDEQPGYAVKYSDGYISWSPKAVFEESYLPLGQIGGKPPYQQRVIAESAALDDKYNKLTLFMSTEQYMSLDDAEKIRLCTQRAAMAAYSNALRDRIAAF